jgi:hypothetical protein
LAKVELAANEFVIFSDDFDRYCRLTSERTFTRLEAANTLTVSAFDSMLVVHRPEVIAIKTSFFAQVIIDNLFHTNSQRSGWAIEVLDWPLPLSSVLLDRKFGLE